MSDQTELKKALGPVMLWGLGVGYVISGMYFGWNLGLSAGGPYGLLVATVLITAMYITFVLSYAELACAIPRAGGAFVYGSRALGAPVGFLAGGAQIVEFVFAPPAIAAAIGAYSLRFLTDLQLVGAGDADLVKLAIAVFAYLAFTGLNVYGVTHSAVFELVITVIAVAGLVLFIAVCGPHFQWSNFARDPLPAGPSGIFAAFPFAIWFYLAIEGLANVAEESRDPQRDIDRGFSSAIATLVVLAILTFFCAVGVAGWRAVVFPPGESLESDSPLPLAVAGVVGTKSVVYYAVIAIGLAGLVASFHGIILVAGRAIFEFGRVGYAPRIVGTTLPRRKTPAVALVISMFVGLVALVTGRTGEIITVSAFGALTLYAVSMIALVVLRRTEPDLERPFHAPFYPWFPLTALVLAIVSLVAMTYYNPGIALVYLGLLGAGFVWFYLVVPGHVRAQSFAETGEGI